MGHGATRGERGEYHYLNRTRSTPGRGDDRVGPSPPVEV